MSTSLTPVVLSQHLKCITRLLLKLRDEVSDRATFAHYANRLMTIICEEGLSHIQYGLSPLKVKTPTGSEVEDLYVDNSSLVIVSIIRAADSMLDCFLKICPEVSVGKILIQRNEETAQPEIFYKKLPNLAGKQIILLDPMLATGGSAKAAIKILIDSGADPSRIAFFSVISCPFGIESLGKDYPSVQIVTAHVDEKLNEKAYIVPGLGDYGDRFFGTTNY